jgi:hypothetical protein
MSTQVILEWATPFIQAVAPILVAAGVAYIAKHVSDQNLRDALDTALQRAPGIALAELQANAGAINSEAEQLAAKSKAIAYVEQNVPGALKAFGVTPDKLATMVGAEIAKAVDQNTTGPSALTPPTTTTVVEPIVVKS